MHLRVENEYSNISMEGETIIEKNLCSSIYIFYHDIVDSDKIRLFINIVERISNANMGPKAYICIEYKG
jgi:hypothetical protein